MNLTKRLWALLLALTLVLGLAACGQKAQDTAADEPAATTDEPAAGDAGAPACREHQSARAGVRKRAACCASAPLSSLGQPPAQP